MANRWRSHSWAVVAHTLNPALGGRGWQVPVSSRPAWSTTQVPGQPEMLSRETLSVQRKGGGGRKKERANSNLMQWACRHAASTARAAVDRLSHSHVRLRHLELSCTQSDWGGVPCCGEGIWRGCKNENYLQVLGFCLCVIVWDRISLYKPKRAGIELTKICLPWVPECWGCKYEPSFTTQKKKKKKCI